MRTTPTASSVLGVMRGWPSLLTGERVAAREAYLDVLETDLVINEDRGMTPTALLGIAALAADGEPHTAARLVGAASAHMVRLGRLLAPPTLAAYDAVMVPGRSRLGEAAWQAAWTAGRTLAIEEAANEGRLALQRLAGASGAQPHAAGAAAELGLTRRELEVLRPGGATPDRPRDRRPALHRPPHRLQARRGDPGQARRSRSPCGRGRSYAPRPDVTHPRRGPRLHAPHAVADAWAIMEERAAGKTTDGGMSGAPDTWPISARDAAAMLGVSERTIRRAIARGDLPATKRAGVYRIAPADLARYGAALRRATAPDPPGTAAAAPVPRPGSRRHARSVPSRSPR